MGSEILLKILFNPITFIITFLLMSIFNWKISQRKRLKIKTGFSSSKFFKRLSIMYLFLALVTFLHLIFSIML